MPLVARAFPIVVNSSCIGNPAVVDLPGLLIDSAAGALAGILAEDVCPLVIVVPSVWFVAPLKQALRVRCALPGASWIPPPIDTLAGHASAADRAGIAGSTRSRYSRLLAMANRLASGAAPPDAGESSDSRDRRQSGWPARFQRAGSLLDLVDAIDAARAIDALASAGADSSSGSGPVGTADYLQALVGSLPGSQDALLGADLRLLAAIADDVAATDDPVPVQARQWEALLGRWQQSRPTVARVGMRALQPLSTGAAAAVDDRHDRVLAAFLARDPSLRLLDLHPGPGSLQEAAPVLCAAWPELQGEPVQGEPAAAPIGARRLAGRVAPGEHARAAAAMLHARTREEEAALAALWVHGRLAAGARSLAILVMDRWLARRTRALLERSRILIDDREGWALSTTVAASLVMAWLDYCTLPDERPHPGPRSALALTTLLDAAFTTEPAAPALVAAIRHKQRGRGARGAGANGPAGPAGPAGPDSDALQAAALENRLASLAARQRRCARVGDHLDCLRSVLGVLGAMATLQQDEAGRQLLALLDSLPSQAPAGCRLDQFRALLGFAMESQRFYDGSIASPVRMIGLGPALAARYDAVLVLGANDGKLPATVALPPGVTESMLPLLGLRPIAQQALEQTTELAWVLAGAGEWALTCRTESSDGSLPSQLVERLAAVAELDLAATHHRVPPRLLPAGDDVPAGDRWPMPRPAGVVPRMPQEVAVGAFERLVGCPYEFLVADVWRLTDQEDPTEAPGKRELGNIVHEVLLRFHEQIETPHDDDRPMIELLSSLTRTVVAATPSLRSSRLVHLQEWYAQMPGYVRQFREDYAAGWRFLDGEKRIRGVIDYRAAATDGPKQLRVRGKYDRLDQREEVLRIVDYKLQDSQRIGRKAKDPDQAAQLMLYSWFVEAGEAGYLAIDRKGTKLASLDPPPGQILPEWQSRVAGYLGRIAGGEPLRALGSHCDRCQARGVCRQGHWRDE